jgi:peptidoglycan/LPS O-acetylase OafA/YrhL
MMVVLSHCALAFQPGLLSGKPEQSFFPAARWLSSTPLTFFWNPELGVAIFFVLSGFVLASSTSTTRASFTELATRRYVRLTGPILGTSLLIWIMVASGLLYNRTASGLSGSDWLAANFARLPSEGNDLGVLIWQSLIDNYARGNHWWNLALWTMPIELWGSLGLFFAYALLRRWTAPPAMRLVIALAMYALTCQSAYSGFAAGAALFEADCLASWTTMRRLVAAVLGCALLIAGVLVGGTPWNLLPTPYWPAFVWLSQWLSEPILMAHRAGAVFVVAAVLVLPALRKLLNQRLFQFLGRVSFMVYLLHVALICSLFSWLLIWLYPVLGYNGATAVGLVIFLTILLSAAAVATPLIDRTSIKLSRAAGVTIPRAVLGLSSSIRFRLQAARAR